MDAYFWIAVGSGIGGIGRYWFSGFAARRFGETFPWGTLGVNVSGAFAIGVFAGLAGTGGWLAGDMTAQQFLMVGVCGSFTTFSSFSLQTLNLVRDGEWARAWGNVGLSVALCLLAVWLGYALVDVFQELIL